MKVIDLRLVLARQPGNALVYVRHSGGNAERLTRAGDTAPVVNVKAAEDIPALAPAVYLDI